MDFVDSVGVPGEGDVAQVIVGEEGGVGLAGRREERERERERDWLGEVRAGTFL